MGQYFGHYNEVSIIYLGCGCPAITYIVFRSMSPKSKMPFMIGKKCVNLEHLGTRTNCKTSLPWLGRGEVDSNTPWLRRRVFAYGAIFL